MILYVYKRSLIYEITENKMTEEPQNTPASQVSYPLNVHYCGACTMPLEYCEYSSCKEKCREWLEKNLPDLAGGLSVTEGETTSEEKKHQKRGGKGSGKPKKEKEAPGRITLQLSARSKNKKVTIVKGLSSFGIEPKVAGKFFSSRFACGCSVGPDEVTIQGDFKDELFDVIPEKWKQVDEDDIEDLGGEEKMPGNAGGN
ncbi:hypothetical protein FO519_005536 [Halicephalobus sp. NKZ332]|nr:hypothetical protein FO519_005536 [Halicephalobus sp. NKZ332]